MDVSSFVNERVSSSILLGQMVPRMLVTQHNCFRSNIVDKRNDRSLVRVGIEYDVDFDLNFDVNFLDLTMTPR